MLAANEKGLAFARQGCKGRRDQIHGQEHGPRYMPELGILPRGPYIKDPYGAAPYHALPFPGPDVPGQRRLRIS
jgi:hypothetical protein